MQFSLPKRYLIPSLLSNMRIKEYVQATHETLSKGQDPASVLTALHAYLSSRGLQKLYPSILRGEKLKRSERSTKPKVIVARNQDLERHAREIAEALTRVSQDGSHEIHIEPSIIGGFIVKGKNEQIDHSHKGTLLRTYRTLTE